MKIVAVVTVWLKLTFILACQQERREYVPELLAASQSQTETIATHFIGEIFLELTERGRRSKEGRESGLEKAADRKREERGEPDRPPACKTDSHSFIRSLIHGVSVGIRKRRE